MSQTSSNKISRSDFVKSVTVLLGLLMSSITGLPAILYIISPALRIKKIENWIPLGPLENYPLGVPTPANFTRTQINGWEKTIISNGVFVIRQYQDRVLVLSNICTHLSCRVSWQPDLQHYVSPCHNGHFDLVGQVVSGPPPRPLDEFLTKIEDGSLFIRYPPFRRS